MKLTKSKILLIACFLYILAAFVYSLIKVPQIKGFDQYYDQDIKLEGIITSEVKQEIDQQNFELQSENIPGKIFVITELYPNYRYGDQLSIRTKLKQPLVFEDFDYRQYLAQQEIYTIAYNPQIDILNRNQGNWFYQRVFNFKNELRKVIDQILLPPHADILKAVFLGDKWSISDQFKEKLNISGTRHIVSISGMHMIIVTQILMFTALALGLWRQQAFYLVIVLMFLYIIMIGAPASAVRAGIMAGLILLAQNLGRLRNPIIALVLAATLMLLFDPMLIKSDIGFQLSFMATLSIIYLKPILDKKIKNWPDFFHLKDILTMTLAAQIGVLPLLVFHFGQFSLISPVANLLIVPLLPIIMILGIIVSFVGLFWLNLAEIIIWPIWLILTYVIKIIDYLSSFSWASSQSLGQFPFLGLTIIIYYLFLFLIILKCSKRKRLFIHH